MKIPIIGQEAICPDGLGRVVAYNGKFPKQWIRVSTYVNDRQCEWAPHNVELIDPRGNGIELERLRHELQQAQTKRDTYLSRLKDENALVALLKAGLEAIREPIAHLEREAQRAAGKLDGSVAVQLADSPAYLREMAADTLAKASVLCYGPDEEDGPWAEGWEERSAEPCKDRSCTRYRTMNDGCPVCGDPCL